MLLFLQLCRSKTVELISNAPTALTALTTAMSVKHYSSSPVLSETQDFTCLLLGFRFWFHGLAFLKVSSLSQLMRISSNSWKLNVGLVAQNRTCLLKSLFVQSLKMLESITLTLKTFLVNDNIPPLDLQFTQ